MTIVDVLFHKADIIENPVPPGSACRADRNPVDVEQVGRARYRMHQVARIGVHPRFPVNLCADRAEILFRGRFLERNNFGHGSTGSRLRRVLFAVFLADLGVVLQRFLVLADHIGKSLNRLGDALTAFADGENPVGMRLEHGLMGVLPFFPFLRHSQSFSASVGSP